MNIIEQKRQIIIKAVVAAVMTGIIIAVVVSVPLINHTHTLTAQLAANFADTKTMSVRTLLDQHQDIARQTASRSELARMLARYNNGEVSIDELAAFTQPRLQDAAQHIDNLAAIIRFDRSGKEVARIGPMADALPARLPHTTRLDIQSHSLSGAHKTAPLLQVTSHIQSGGELAGHDLLLFSLEPLVSILQSGDDTRICLLDTPKTRRVALNPDTGGLEITPPVGCLAPDVSDPERDPKDFFRATTGDGTQVLTFIRPIEGYQWQVHIRSRVSKVFGALIHWSIFTVLVIIGLSAVSGLLITRGLKPILHTLTQQAEKIARSSDELRLAYQVFEHTDEAIVITDTSFKIARANPAFSEVTGKAGRKLSGKNIMEFLDTSKIKDQVPENVSRQLVAHESWQGEIWLKRGNGNPFPNWLTISPLISAQGEVKNFALAFSDITERVKSERQIRRMAHIDNLTGLPNRAALETHLDQTIQQSRGTSKSFAVMFLDLDNFKPVNDTYGHQVGDELLVNVGKRLQNCLRNEDIVGRRGGDEFVVITAALKNAKHARPIAEKMVAVLNRTFDIQGHRIQISASVGIALYPDNGTTAEELLNCADAAMYSVKSMGRNDAAFA